MGLCELWQFLVQISGFFFKISLSHHVLSHHVVPLSCTLAGELKGIHQSPTLTLELLIEKKPNPAMQIPPFTDCTARVLVQDPSAQNFFHFLNLSEVPHEFLHLVLSLLGLLQWERSAACLGSPSHHWKWALNTNGFVRFSKDESTKLLTVTVMSPSVQLLLKLVMLCLQDWTSEEFSGYLQTWETSSCTKQTGIFLFNAASFVDPE